MGWLHLFLLVIFCGIVASSECEQRKYDQDSFVCVCNSQSCDSVDPLDTFDSNTAIIYSTGRDGGRLSKESQSFTTKSGSTRVRIFPQKTYQQIIGFGGAITDASMIVLDRLRKVQNVSCPLCELLQNQYYGQNDGISYNLGRINIASCDFSDREYSYLEKDQDFELESFKLSEFEYNRTEFLRQVIKKTNGMIKLFASPWSAPAWMKTSNHMKGGGSLKGSVNGIYYLTYARYFLRFFEEYYKEGIKFWGLTLIN